MITDREKHFMQLAIEESTLGLHAGHGGPFGCIIVKGDEVIARAHNEVLCSNDPTAHAEVVAIRKACAALGNFQLDGCEMYCSCEPCPMCLGAIYWARPDKVYYANEPADAAAVGFDDQFIYDEINLPKAERRIPFIALRVPNQDIAFKTWQQMENKHLY